MSFKRPRTPTKSSDSESSSPSLQPTPKSTRKLTSSSSRPFLCTLPPTCNPPRNQPTHIANTKELESHYATYHAHVCEFQSCGCVFPDAKLLELHQTECHDPLAALRRERGEKIFACHLTTCPRVFSTPKTRRLHLIDTHGYPKEYFFAVTNKGVGGLLKKWGEGVSMLRKEWKERDGDGDDDGTDDRMEADCDDIPADGEIMVGDPYTDTTHARPPPPQQQQQHKPPAQSKQTPAPDDQLDGLTSSMTSLSLVPPSIRFGRGGKSGGFGNANANGSGIVNAQVEAQTQAQNQAQNQNQAQSVEPQRPANAVLGQGRGRGRGRGRGFIHQHPHPPPNGHHIIPGIPRGRFSTRGLPVGRGGIINVPVLRGRGVVVGIPRSRGRGGPPALN
ncbi:hypothetical protein PILCRDRAFT_811943 [Piloderma croceum F 1598]|uniref:C2H2-type domain-containing protein n=1 Tax=Piloderma croceum (strain F 1598) TaxID=765440 RepID=A0A0C3GEV6_PILCF|nr:hypothetical protein PILCRDRAFT_811943 [Piloderma croceum F 1598]